MRFHSETIPKKNNRILIPMVFKSHKHMPHIHSLDYLRVVMCILVIIWHGKLLKNIFSNPIIEDIIYYNITLLAVPVFFIISLFIFYYKKILDWEYTRNRVKKISIIFIFWFIFFNIHDLFSNITLDEINDLTYFNYIDLFLQQKVLPNKLYLNQYFFLLDLILLTIFARINANYLTNRRIQYTLLISSMVFIIIGATIIAFRNIEYAFLINFRIFTNFLPYIFAAALIKQDYITGLKKINKKIIIYMILFLGSSLIEWQILKNTFYMPPYTRVSLVFGSMAIMYLFLKIKTKTPMLIRIISDNTLGIYCMHIYFLSSVNIVEMPVLDSIIKITISLLIPTFISSLMKKTGYGRYIF